MSMPRYFFFVAFIVLPRFGSAAPTPQAESAVAITHDYYVEMTRNQEGLFEAVMPQPTQETDRVIYYVEAVDNEFNATQTAEYDPNVVASGSCDYRRFLGVPSIVIGSLVAKTATTPTEE